MLKYVKCYLKTENNYLKAQTKHHLRLLQERLNGRQAVTKPLGLYCISTYTSITKIINN